MLVYCSSHARRCTIKYTIVYLPVVKSGYDRLLRAVGVIKEGWHAEKVVSSIDLAGVQLH